MAVENVVRAIVGRDRLGRLGRRVGARGDAEARDERAKDPLKRKRRAREPKIVKTSFLLTVPYCAEKNNYLRRVGPLRPRTLDAHRVPRLVAPHLVHRSPGVPVHFAVSAPASGRQGRQGGPPG